MDKFFSGFNLQNLLRQFCCGVVFFVPLYLFIPYEFNRVWCQAGIVKDKLICIAVLSFIIGTVIYHLEKNLYSYLIQAAFERIGRNLLCIALIIFILGFIGLWGASSCSSLLSCLLILLLLACVICLCLPLLSKDFNPNAEDDPTDRIYCKIVDNLIKRTELCWWIEEYTKGTKIHQYAIAKKVSIWSDFIHCVQSCCFAWILGSSIAYYFHPCRVYKCDASCCDALQHICIGIIIAILILLVEIGIDAHRYIHVKRMTSSHEIIYVKKHEKEIKMDSTTETQER